MTTKADYPGQSHLKMQAGSSVAISFTQTDPFKRFRITATADQNTVDPTNTVFDIQVVNVDGPEGVVVASTLMPWNNGMIRHFDLKCPPGKYRVIVKSSLSANFNLVLTPRK